MSVDSMHCNVENIVWNEWYPYAKMMTFYCCFSIRNGLDRTYGSETIYSQHDADMLKNVMREKEDFEKHSAHKLAILQDQVHQKNLEIRDLEGKLNDVVSLVWCLNVYIWKLKIVAFGKLRLDNFWIETGATKLKFKEVSFNFQVFRSFIAKNS